MKDILRDILNSRFDKHQVIELVQTHEHFFQLALELASSNEEPIAWRAAWILGHCAKKNDLRIAHKTDELIQSIEGKKDGHQRELLKIVSKVPLNDEQEGLVFELCSAIWMDISKSSSVRSIALRFLVNTAFKYPDLKSEVLLLMQNHYAANLSPGLKKSYVKMKKSLKS
jgi:hypothetical protein